jgi:hypothetical protein
VASLVLARRSGNFLRELWIFYTARRRRKQFLFFGGHNGAIYTHFLHSPPQAKKIGFFLGQNGAIYTHFGFFWGQNAAIYTHLGILGGQNATICTHLGGKMLPNIHISGI